jgi:RNA polymerase sigma-70 factor (ECF subfamily)
VGSATLASRAGLKFRLLERCEPLRPELYRYCRYLTRSPWDAEDLVQDTLARAFVALGCVHQEIENPRAWLFRVASNQWMNHRRHVRAVPSDLVAQEPPAPPAPEPQASREAAWT